MATHVDLGKMVGPLPLGAWVAVVGAGLGFMVYQRKQADIVPTTDATQLQPSDPGGIDGVGDGSVGGWVTTTPGTGGTGSVAPTTITTNEEWAVAAENWLIAQGYDPAVADSAIRKYMDQETGYSSAEYAMVTMALGHLGAPPSPLPAPVFGNPTPGPITGGGGGGSAPPPPVIKPPVIKPPVVKPPVVKPPVRKPVPKPVPPKPAVRHYTVRSGDSLWSIAVKYYHNGSQWPRIYNANKAKIGSNPNLIHVGTVLVIP